MAQADVNTASKSVAVVTGANKGIGFEICRKLASNGIVVVLTARDEKRGNEAAEKLKVQAVTDVVFHQLDLMNSASIVALAEFLKAHFGRVDILVNNAGISGTIVTPENRKILKYDYESIVGKSAVSQRKLVQETYEMAEDCLTTNYFGVKQLTQALIPLLQQSSYARIVNVSSTLGQLQNIPKETAKKNLGDVDSLTEEKIDKVVEDYLRDFNKLDHEPESKGWPALFSAYMVSKASLNAYTRLLPNKYPKIKTNAVSPGFVRTDLNDNSGIYSVEEGARGPVTLALMAKDDSPSGLFFDQTELSEF